MRQHRKSNILLIPFTVLTVSIVVLCVLVQLLLQSSLDEMKSDAEITDIALKERTLCHQVVSSIAADNLAGKITQPPLDNLLRAFYSTQQSLAHIHNAGTKKAAPYMVQLINVDSAYENMSRTVMLNVNSETDNNDKFVLLLNSQSRFINQLDAFISAVTGNSNAKIEKFKAEELILTAISLAIIFLEVVFIFVPAIKKIKRQSQQFKAIAFHNSHIIRQPLANIKGLLDIIDEDSVHGETREMLQLIKSEADKLDEVIHTNIYNTLHE
ncbi:MAG TPA: histidine kinase dimerization/phospho-acceptor domain-containing protein [Chitinophagaceae bacterium]|nr:histidine kinase dimerization/phospho-acceptor domain-containing protein [Chitinophagaceae bacterium]